jgi:hypothetical protein
MCSAVGVGGGESWEYFFAYGANFAKAYPKWKRRVVRNDSFVVRQLDKKIWL